jgi:hypothetical protein
MESSNVIKKIFLVQNLLNLLLPLCFIKVFIIDKNQSIWVVGLFVLYIVANLVVNFKYRTVELSSNNKRALWISLAVTFVIGLITIYKTV